MLLITEHNRPPRFTSPKDYCGNPIQFVYGSYLDINSEKSIETLALVTDKWLEKQK